MRALVIVLLVFGAARLAASAPVDRLDVGGRVEGELGPSDERQDADFVVDAFRLDGCAGQVTVLAESDEVDARLWVADDTGATVTEDDQGGIGDNPRVVLACEAGRTYTVRVGTTVADAGAYVLRVVAGEDPPPLASAKPEADIAYYTRAVECARARGALGRRRLGWALARRNNITLPRGLAPTAEILQAAEEAIALAREVGDRKLEATGLNQSGAMHDQSGRSRDAVALLERARAIYRDLGDVANEIRPVNNLAMILQNLGESDRAIQHYEEAVALCEKAGERRLLAWVLSNLAAAHDSLRQYERVAGYQERALAVAREVGDLRLLSLIVNNLARTQTRLGNYQRAIDGAEEGLQFARAAGDRHFEANALEAIAEGYLLVGRGETAILYQGKALALLREMGAPRDEGAAHTQMAEIQLSLDRDDRAIEHYEEALRCHRAAGDTGGEAIALVSLGDTHVRARQWARALASFERARTIAVAGGDKMVEAFAWNGVALVRLHEGRLTQAAELAERAALAMKELGVRDGEWNARTTRARALARLGRKEDARRDFLAALALIEETRAAAGSDASRAGYFDRAAGLFETYVGFLTDIGETEAALEAAERARARAFLDRLASRGSAAETRLAVAASPSVEEIREEARRREATVVEYFVSEDRLFTWVVTPTGPIHSVVAPIGRERLTARVRELRAALGMDVAAREWAAEDAAERAVEPPPPVVPAASARAAEVLRGLHDVLIAPIERWLPRDPERSVTIVPHGPLFLVSFAALEDGAGRYLVERNTLSYVPSIGVLRYAGAQVRPAPLEAPTLLVVGNPQMPPLPGRSRAVPPLPGAEDEARTIRSLFPDSRVTLLTGAAAEERAVRKLAGSHSMIHLATHGFIRDDAPQDSLLALAPSSGAAGAIVFGEDDGLLTVREISEMELHAQLVVLSACNTGLGRITGDGVSGLARAFLSAGSPSVLASLWRVADVVGSPHMEHFYRAFRANGGHPADALRKAQLATLHDLKEKRHRTPSGVALPSLPTFWASFVVIGEPR